MAKHIVSRMLPPPLDEERFSRNGMVPDAVAMKRLADGFNFVACRRKKQFFMKCQPMDSVAAGSALSQTIWRFAFRTGHGTDAVHIAAGMALTDYGLSTGPTAHVNFVDALTSTLTATATWSFSGSSAGTTVTPNELHHIQETLTGLSPNTEYVGQWGTNQGARLVYCSLAEAESMHADDSLTGLSSPAPYTAEAPVYDADIAELVTANNELWRHNGSHLIGWAADYAENSAPVTSSLPTRTTYTNIIDGSSTAVSAASAGWKLFTQYHNTVRRTTVPVTFKVWTDRLSGTGTLDVKLTDGTNSITITGLGDVNAWSSTTANIPVQNGTQWDLHVRNSNLTTDHRIIAMALYENEP